jgi:serine/threonine-protein kinase
MALTSGTRIGSYEVTALIGEGGMGQVYRATDINLGRQVAIKILPDTFAHDPERVARFEREAKTLASLNHRNIAAIYGFEKAGIPSLIMELIEGPTLADRIAQGPIPVDEALFIAKQVAEALEAAHEQGIIHRDLKPANIKLRQDGTVKVLDFGLAKAVELVDEAASVSQLPTMTSPAMMTGVGVLLGTAAYMSPEQARSKPVDKRSDIWAFGCVLYEMLASRPAFADEDVSLTVSNILRRDPDWVALPAAIPRYVCHTLRLCLMKDPRERLQAIGDVRLAMQGAFQTERPLGDKNRGGRVTGWRRLAMGGIASLILGAFIGANATWFEPTPDPPRLVRTEITGSAASALSIQGRDRDLAITPDGSRIVYRGADGLFVRALDQLEPMQIGGIEDPRNIFTSPDGQWVGFFANGSLSKIPITGGPAVKVTAVGVYTPRGAAWGPDETIIYATTAAATGLQRVSATGGDPARLTNPDEERGEAAHVWPEFLPGGRSVLFTILPRGPTINDAQIAVLDLATGRYKLILRGGSHAHYSPTGHLVYAVGGALHAVRFDLAQLAVVGSSVPILEDVVTTATGAMDAMISRTGTLVYARGTFTSPQRRLVWVDRNGGAEPVVTIEPADYLNLRLSPNARDVAITFQNDVWIHDIRTGRRTRLTRDGSVTTPAVWDPTGSRVAYTSTRGGGQNVWLERTDGSGEARQLTKLDGIVDVDSWSPDGRVLAVHHHRPDGGMSMLMLRMDTDAPRAEPFVEEEPWAEGTTFSPDGRFVAYMSSETGRREVYIRAYPRNGGSVPVSVGGGREAIWSPTGELFYRNETGDRMMAVSVSTQPMLRLGDPKEVFAGRFSINAGGSPRPVYDLAPDGRRFLMLQDTRSASEPQAPRIVVVQHFDQELKRTVPTN